MKKVNYRLLIEIVFVFIIVMGVVLFASSNIDKNLKEEKARLSDVLTTILKIENQAIDTWFQAKKLHIEDIAKTEEVVTFTTSLLSASHQQDSLLLNPIQDSLRSYFEPIINKHDYYGIFIISPAHISLSSMRDENIGTTNIIAKKEGDKLKKAFAGETVLITPFVSEVALTSNNKQAATMFIATPVRDSENNIIAVFTFRLNPKTSLSSFTESGWFNKSSNTFAFDDQGQIITQSRHEVAESTKNLEDIKGLGSKLINPQDQKLIESVRSTLNNKQDGVNINGYINYKGQQVFGSWLWNEKLGFGLTCEITETESMISHKRYRNSVITSTLVIILVIIALSVYIIFSKHQLRRTNLIQLRRLGHLKSSLNWFVEQAPIGIALASKNGRFLKVNEEFSKITGYSLDDLKHLTHNDILISNNSLEHEQLMNMMKDGSKITAIEQKYIHSSGAIKNVFLSGFMHLDADHDDSAWVIIQDITELKQREAAIRLIAELSDLFLGDEQNIEKIYQLVLEEVCCFMSWQFGHAFKYHESEKAFLSTGVWFAEDKEKYMQLVQNTNETLGAQAPLHKKVLESGTTIWDKDISKRKGVIREELIKNTGLKGAYIVPIKIDQKIVTVLEFFSDRTFEADPVIVRLLDEIGNRLGSILKQKNLLNEIRESKITRDRMIANASYPIVVLNNSQQIIKINNKFIDLFGYQEEDILEKHCSEVLPMFQRNKFSNQSSGEVTPPPSFSMEIGLEATAKKIDGTDISVETSFTPLNDEKGTVMVSIQDISERKKAEDRIRKSEERLAIALKAGKLGVWDWDLTSGQMVWDDSMYALYDISREDFKNDYEAFEQLLHTDDIEFMNNLIEKTISEGKTLDTIFRIIDTQGKIRYIAAKGNVQRDESGNAVRMTGVNANITQELEIKQELINSNKELERFAYIASHDLQEPLRVINSYLQIIEKKYTNGMEEKGLYLMERVMGATKRMKSLINDLLEYSRIGKKERAFRKTDLTQLVDAAIKDSEILINEHDARVKVEELGHITCDAGQIFQVFMNLINNGIKYRRPEVVPEIVISAQVSKPNTLEITFQDNGIGIKEEFQERIFEIFQRLHTQDEYSGTGLGLAITKKIIESHNGTIRVESTYGEGSKFILELPIELQKRKQNEEKN